MRSATKIIHVVGARPNFMKVAPVMAALAKYDGISQLLLHTGQHYDVNMSDIFFQQLEMPAPHINLEVGSGSHAHQTAQIMSRLEPVVLDRKPDLVLVYGDVNSTVAAAMVCAKLQIPVGHVEAGLRSFDRTMPEEINRLLTDQIADMLFTPSFGANENLLREGIAPGKIYFVGNVMIDSLLLWLPKTQEQWKFLCSSLNLDVRYGVVTLHRPSNVDNPFMLKSIMTTLSNISHNLPVFFPIHPRTRQRLIDLNIEVKAPSLKLIEPIGYLDFLTLQRNAIFVITDSGGIQEETTFLGIPCLTLRENTERPITTTLGTNILVGGDMDRLRYEVDRILGGNSKKGQIPPLWDGKAGDRIAEIITKQSRASC